MADSAANFRKNPYHYFSPYFIMLSVCHNDERSVAAALDKRLYVVELYYLGPCRSAYQQLAQLAEARRIASRFVLT